MTHRLFLFGFQPEHEISRNGNCLEHAGTLEPELLYMQMRIFAGNLISYYENEKV